MEPLALSPEGRFPPLLKCHWIVELVYGFVETLWKAFSKVSNGEGVIDVEVSMSDEFFEF